MRSFHFCASLVVLAASLLFGACASARYSDGIPSAEIAPSDTKRGPRAPRPAESALADKERSDSKTTGGEADTDEPAEEPAEPDQEEQSPAARMVVYQGQMEIRVISPMESARQVGVVAAKLDGRVEKSDFYDGGRRIVIVLRVPVARFFEAMDMLPALGTVLSRSLSAEDVTKEFADVESRLRSTRMLKERLEKLLETVKNVDEKVKILREISRLATQIETLTARSKYLADRASMSTITLQLVAEPSRSDAPDRRSPFPWVRDLDPAKRTIEEPSGLEPKRPDGFFDNAKRYRSGEASLFYSADGTVLRSGQLKNRPTGDAAFWRQALSLEFKRRSYSEVKTAAISDGQLWVFQIHDGLNIYYYGISFIVRGDRIHVLEGFAPGEQAFKQDGDRMQSFLRSVGGGGK